MAAYVILTAFLFQRGSAESEIRTGRKRTRRARRRPLRLRKLPSTPTRWASPWLASSLPRSSCTSGEATGRQWRKRPCMEGPQHSLIAHLGDMGFWFDPSRTGSPSFLRQRRWSSSRSCSGSAARRSRSMWTRAMPRPGARRGRCRPCETSRCRRRRSHPLRRHAASLRAGDRMALARGCRAYCRGSFSFASWSPERTIFTRFIPARRPGEGQGAWRRYYRHWASMTIEAVGADMVELMPELPATCRRRKRWTSRSIRPGGGQVCTNGFATGTATRWSSVAARRTVRPCHGSRRSRSRLRTVLVQDAVCKQLGREPRSHARALRKPLWPARGGRHRSGGRRSCGVQDVWARPLHSPPLWGGG